MYLICLLFIFLILVGVELPLCIIVTILECYNLFYGVKLSIRSFYFITVVVNFSISYQIYNDQLS